MYRRLGKAGFRTAGRVNKEAFTLATTKRLFKRIDVRIRWHLAHRIAAGPAREPTATATVTSHSHEPRATASRAHTTDVG